MRPNNEPNEAEKAAITIGRVRSLTPGNHGKSERDRWETRAGGGRTGKGAVDEQGGKRRGRRHLPPRQILN
jgi:hypothetical protein